MRKVSLIAAVLFLAACSNWEATTYQTLSAAKATLNCAIAEYDHSDAQITQYCAGVATPSAVYIPQTAQNRQIIANAETAKDAAVNAMITYESAKAAKNSTDMATLQANVTAAVTALTSDITAVAALVAGGK